MMSRILDRESGKGPIRLPPQNIYTIYDPTDLQKVISNASLGSLIHYYPPNQQGSVTYQLVMYNGTKVAVEISNYYEKIYHKLREPPYTFERLQENPAPNAAPNPAPNAAPNPAPNAAPNPAPNAAPNPAPNAANAGG
jgi:hypothetical protein